MNKISSTLTIKIILILLLVSSGCNTNETPKDEMNELTIAAASNLALAFTEAGKVFEEQTNSKITFSFGSSGQLADQIENGAPFDLFASANSKFIDHLQKENLIIPDTQIIYAYGRIGIATLSGGTSSIETLEDLLKPEIKKIAIANPGHAPYGVAAKQALENAGLWEQIENKLVYGKNISDTLTFIETGNVEAGIIALSLYNEEEVNLHLINEDLHAPLEQSIAVINRTSQENLAKEFIHFIKGPIGKPIMESYGFVVPEED